MKKILYTTTAFVLCGGIVQTNAACIATPSCTAMGYTSSSSCTNGIKCPFGNYWNCANSDLSNKITELENKINSGAGTDPSDKTYDCKIGDIFYSDWTCSTEVVSGKTPIAVVVYMDGAGHGQALALNSIGNYSWQSGDYCPIDQNGEKKCVDVEATPNYSDSEKASQDFNSCINTRMLISSGTPNDFPAAWAANYYKTAGTKAGDWCLPAAGIFTSYYNNKDAVNAGFDTAGGIAIANDIYTWSSSEKEYDGAFAGYFNNSYGLNHGCYSCNMQKEYSKEVRPVIEF